LKLNICLLLMEIRTPMPPRPELAWPLLKNVVTNPTCSVAPVLRSISLECGTSSPTTCFTCFPLGSVGQPVFCGVNLVLSLFKARRIRCAFVFSQCCHCRTRYTPEIYRGQAAHRKPLSMRPSIRSSLIASRMTERSRCYSNPHPQTIHPS
jgi:hypothetical protein